MKEIHLLIDICFDCPYAKHMKGAIFMCMLPGNGEKLFDVQDGIPEWCELSDYVGEED